MKIKAILATDLNGCIGKNNTIPWRQRADMKHFAKLTRGGVVIMGRKTFESMGSKPLKHRINIVVSRTLKEVSFPDLYLATSLEQALEIAYRHGTGRTIWAIGGTSVYGGLHDMQSYDEIHHTLIRTKVQGADVRAPEVLLPSLITDWESLTRVPQLQLDPFYSTDRESIVMHAADDENQHDYAFITYR